MQSQVSHDKCSTLESSPLPYMQFFNFPKYPIKYVIWRLVEGFTCLQITSTDQQLATVLPCLYFSIGKLTHYLDSSIDIYVHCIVLFI